MTDELDIEAISPSTIFISGESITEQDAMDEIDKVLNELYVNNNLNDVDVVIDTLLGLQRISGKALAKLLYGSKRWWAKDKNFDDHMESRHGLKKVTIDRYITVWESIVTNTIPAPLQERPMRDLIPIAKAISQGYELTKPIINRLIKATSSSEIGAILRTVKNKAPRKSSLQITWARDGSLYAWKDDKRHHIGWLDKDAYETDEVAKKAINRILDNAGVVKK